MRRLAVAVLVVGLAGCARDVIPSQLVAPMPEPTVRSSLQFSPLSQQVAVAEISATWFIEPFLEAVEISSEDLRFALRQSLADAGLLGEDDAARYLLTVVPRNLFWDDVVTENVIANIDYRLIDTSDGRELFDQAISTDAPIQPLVADTFVEASEAAVAANFTELIRQLSELRIE